MNYTSGYLLFQDRPEYGWLMKLVLFIPAVHLAVSVILFFSGEASGSLAFLLEAALVGMIFWFVFPREYQVYEDRLRVVLGGPFSVNIGFQDIKEIRVTSRTAFTANLVTRMARSYVIIVKKKGLNIAITPTDNALFVAEANRAFERWARTARPPGRPPF